MLQNCFKILKKSVDYDPRFLGYNFDPVDLVIRSDPILYFAKASKKSILLEFSSKSVTQIFQNIYFEIEKNKNKRFD
jgi:hypothetical protein